MRAGFARDFFSFSQHNEVKDGLVTESGVEIANSVTSTVDEIFQVALRIVLDIFESVSDLVFDLIEELSPVGVILDLIKSVLGDILSILDDAFGGVSSGVSHVPHHIFHIIHEVFESGFRFIPSMSAFTLIAAVRGWHTVSCIVIVTTICLVTVIPLILQSEWGH
jgi:phage-related protein